MMTTFTIETDIDIDQKHFKTAEDLYGALQEKITFEEKLQKWAQRALEMDESQLLNI